jgi:CDP-diacylglycerol--glycerol-3-phosphate 3-phosphatidyltransferase/cardiolipin synthase
MGRYRARDLVRVPGLLSLSRLPLAVAFPLVVSRPLAALSVLVVAGLSDVLDGWYARRHGQVTPTGAVVDPVTDKIFVLTVAVTLVLTRHLTIASVLLLSTRELGELPLVLWLAFSRHARLARAGNPTANLAGKTATALQFVTVTFALFRDPLTPFWVAATAGAGVVAAAAYWRRALS